MSESETSGARPVPGAATAAADHLRIERLEREATALRRLVRMLILVLAVFLGLASALVIVAVRHGMPGFVPSIIESRSFLLRGSDGTPRGHFGVGADGSVRLSFLDGQGRQRVELNLQGDNTAGLAFSDENNRPRLVVALLPDGAANIVMADGAGQTRAVMGLTPDGASTVALADKRGVTKVGLGVDGVGRATVNVSETASPTPADTASNQE